MPPGRAGRSHAPEGPATTPRSRRSERRLTRRRFLALAGAGVAVASAGRLTPRARAAAAIPGAVAWSSLRLPSGRPPGVRDVVRIRGTVLVDRDVSVAGIVVEDGGSLVFDPEHDRTVRSTGNVVVRGRLAMRPASADVEHRLVFVGVDERGFVGGGMDPLDGDVGLWVMGRGVLSLRGTRRLAWTRAAGAVPARTSTVTLQDDPVGWRVGDEVAIVPTAPPTAADHTRAYDVATVTSIDGRTVGLSRPTAFEHPQVSVGRGLAFAPEVLNLTRNVRVEGTGEGRSHVFVRSSRLQSIRHVAIRHVGPRRSDAPGDFVPGRYGLHLHECGDGSRGSRVVGVVVRDAGSHAFVAHNSHGVRFRRCVSHDTLETPYWWDDLPDSRSHDVRYDRCVASAATAPDGGFRLSGFFMGGGRGNVATGCVAVGIDGGTDASGFFWPTARSEGVWTFEGNVAHDCGRHGIFTWQDTGKVHVISAFVAYHNGGYGIEHGAGRNPYWYMDSILYANGEGSLHLVALSPSTETMRFGRDLFDQAGLTPFCVRTSRHPLPAQAPGVFQGCEFRGSTVAAMAFESATVDAGAEVYDVADCSFDGNEFWLDSSIHPDSIVRVFDVDLGAISLHRADQEGELRAEWNARVRPLAAP
jgi:hypothetical protein